MRSEVHPIQLDNPRGPADNVLSTLWKGSGNHIGPFPIPGPFLLREEDYHRERSMESNPESRSSRNYAVYAQTVVLGMSSDSQRQDTWLRVVQVLKNWSIVIKQRVILILCSSRAQNQDKGRNKSKTGSYSKADLNLIYEKPVQKWKCWFVGSLPLKIFRKKLQNFLQEFCGVSFYIFQKLALDSGILPKYNATHVILNFLVARSTKNLVKLILIIYFI